MKRKLEKFSPQDIKDIAEWLTRSHKTQSVSCPFKSRPGDHALCELCKAIFPRLPKNPQHDEPQCPCHVYKPSYVRRVARQIIAKHQKMFKQWTKGA